MNEPESTNTLETVISDVLGIAKESIHDGVTPDTAEEWDSVSHLNLIMALEQEFHISISPEDALTLNSVGRIREFLKGS